MENIQGIEETEVKEEEQSSEALSEEESSEPEVDYKRVNDGLMREISDLRHSRRDLKEKLNQLEIKVEESIKSKETSYDDQMKNLRELRDEHPEKADEINEAIADLMIEKKLSTKLEATNKKVEENTKEEKRQEAFNKSAEEALKLVPDIADSTSNNCKRGLKIGIELGLLVKNGEQYIPVHENAPLIIAKQLLLEQTPKTTSKKQIKKMPSLEGNGSKSSGDINIDDLKKMNRKDREDYFKKNPDKFKIKIRR